MKKYKLITEVSPIQIDFGNIFDLDSKSWEEALKELHCSPIDITKQQPLLPSFITETISEETFKILSNICNIEMDKYGERTYICNNIRMKIEEVNE